MAAPETRAIPPWTRRVPGSSVLLFILLSGGLWMACLLAWEVRQPELVVGLIAVSAFLPIVWLGVRLRTRPVDRKSTRLNSSHIQKSRMPSSA